MATLHTQTDLDALWDFVTESNRIEGIRRRPTGAELDAHLTLLEREDLTVADLVAFVGVMQPDAALRDGLGMNVRVGNHFPPSGGPWIRSELEGVLGDVNASADPFGCHVAYETLHPFTDGNGRSGRAAWLWQMIHQSDDAYALRRGFLHTFYYQSLAARSTPGEAVTEGDTLAVAARDPSRSGALVEPCKPRSIEDAEHSNYTSTPGAREALEALEKDWAISKDGPHEISNRRRWLARQLMDSALSEGEALSIVAYHPSIRALLDASPPCEGWKPLDAEGLLLAYEKALAAATHASPARIGFEAAQDRLTSARRALLTALGASEAQ